MSIQNRNYKVTLHAFGGTMTKIMSADQMHEMTSVWDANGGDYVVETTSLPVSDDVVVKTAQDFENEELEASIRRHPAGKGRHDHTSSVACPACGVPPLPSRVEAERVLSEACDECDEPATVRRVVRYASYGFCALHDPEKPDAEYCGDCGSSPCSE